MFFNAVGYAIMFMCYVFYKITIPFQYLQIIISIRNYLHIFQFNYMSKSVVRSLAYRDIACVCDFIIWCIWALFVVSINLLPFICCCDYSILWIHMVWIYLGSNVVSLVFLYFTRFFVFIDLFMYR